MIIYAHTQSPIERWMLFEMSKRFAKAKWILRLIAATNSPDRWSETIVKSTRREKNTRWLVVARIKVNLVRILKSAMLWCDNGAIERIFLVSDAFIDTKSNCACAEPIFRPYRYDVHLYLPYRRKRIARNNNNHHNRKHIKAHRQFYSTCFRWATPTGIWCINKYILFDSNWP